MYSHFVSCIGVCFTDADHIPKGATLHVTYPVLSIPRLLMPWHQGICRHGINHKPGNLPSVKWEELIVTQLRTLITMETRCENSCLVKHGFSYYNTVTSLQRHVVPNHRQWHFLIIRFTGLLCWESTHRRIPLTKGQCHGKCFHAATSSCFLLINMNFNMGIS